MNFLKLISPVLLCAAIFTGCTEGQAPHYDLNIISPAFSDAYEHYSPRESETVQYELLSSGDWQQAVTRENIKLIDSVTVVDDAVTDETAARIIRTCREENIPVFFFMKDIPHEILSSYDKAYCLTADYNYVGEKFAEKVNEMWQEKIVDKNNDKIFRFSVIKTETLSTVYQEFYDRFLAYLELIGVPLQQNEEIFLTKGDVLSYCMDNKKSNEAFIILHSDYMSAVSKEYEPANDGVEILGMYFGMKNKYSDVPYMHLCFIDYSEYFNVRDMILANIDSHRYPFKDLQHSTIDKTVYIEPEI